jgi:DMSO/TMAO reductase YedYZ heme-binding membrane subunit
MWRPIHALMYFVLLLGFVHGVIIGTDFANLGILIIYSILFGATVLGFIYKRIQQIQSKKKRAQSKKEM